MSKIKIGFMFETGRIDHLSVAKEIETFLLEHPLDLHWLRDGMHLVINKEQVKNAVRLRNEKRQLGLRQTALVFGVGEATLISEPSTNIVKKL